MESAPIDAPFGTHYFIMPPTSTLQELIVAVHFEVPLELAVLDLASWVERYSGDFPIVQQLPPLPRAELSPNIPQMQLQMLTSLELPRMVLRSADGSSSLQLQGDRFALGWNRTEPVGEPSDYPGFELIQDRWEEMLIDFERWLQERFHQSLTRRLIELTYNNAALLERSGKPRRLSEIFRFVQASGRPVSAFSVNWIESVNREEKNPVPARVAAQVALGTAPPSLPVLAFVFSGLGAVATPQESKHMLNDIHDKIRQMYESAIIPDAT